MKKFGLIAFSLLFTMALFCSCSEEPKPKESILEGTWKCNELTSIMLYWQEEDDNGKMVNKQDSIKNVIVQYITDPVLQEEFPALYDSAMVLLQPAIKSLQFRFHQEQVTIGLLIVSMKYPFIIKGNELIINDPQLPFPIQFRQYGDGNNSMEMVINAHSLSGLGINNAWDLLVELDKLAQETPSLAQFHIIFETYLQPVYATITAYDDMRMTMQFSRNIIP